MTPCCDVKPQVVQSPASPEREDLLVLPLASDPFAPPWPINLSALPRLHQRPSTLWLHRFPCPTGSTLVSYHSTYATDLQSFRCNPSLLPYGFGRFLLPSSSASSHRLRLSPQRLWIHLRRSLPPLCLGLQCQQCCSVPSALRLHPGIHQLLRWSSSPECRWPP